MLGIVDKQGFGIASSDFFSHDPELQGAALKKDRGLILYGSEGPKQTLAGSPVGLSDLAAAYRAVFHAGDNEAFISLDPHKEPAKVTVNFGGFLENTRIGAVVLEADKRFKTITSGLDPNSFRDSRTYTRSRVPGFLSGAERDLLSVAQSPLGKWTSTRFWYYPDTIGIDSDLNYEYAVITNPRFTADAERSRDDFTSPEEFQRRKAETLSPSIRQNIDDLNRSYAQYAQAFPEIAELSTVARLMGICSWLFKAQTAWLDLDELLSVELPPCQTEVERTNLIASTFFSTLKGEKPAQQRIIADSKVVFLSPVLDKSVREFFGSAANIVKYLSGNPEPTANEHAKFDSEAARLYGMYQARKVRSIIGTRRDLELLADYAASQIAPPQIAAKEALKSRIANDRSTLEALEVKIEQIKGQMDRETSTTTYNILVDRHNHFVEDYKRLQTQLNQSIDAHNALVTVQRSILEIGGGINLEPSKFAIRASPSSQRLAEFKSRIPGVEVQGTEKTNSAKWISSEPVNRKQAVQTQLEGRDISEAASQVKHWTTVDAKVGSWKSAVKLDSNRVLEKSYDAQNHELQVAEFASGQLQALVVGHKDASGRIVFQKSDRKTALPPQDPPAWYSPN